MIHNSCLFVFNVGSSTRMNANFLFLFLYITSQTAKLQNHASDFLPVNTGLRKCEDLTINVCSEVGYDMTSIPNSRGHVSQEAAQAELMNFLPLESSSCSSSTREFLCAFYAPVCIVSQADAEIMLKPCRHLCESFKAGCEAILVESGFSWPPFFNCSLDTFGEPPVCFANPATTTIPMVSSYAVTEQAATTARGASTLPPTTTISEQTTETFTARTSQENMPSPTTAFPVAESGSMRVATSFLVVLKCLIIAFILLYS